MLYHLFIIPPAIQYLMISILVFLVPWFITIFINRSRDKGQEGRVAYLKFAETFTPFCQRLETGETKINSLIVDEFSKHDLAKRGFIPHLHGSRKKEFDDKWLQYEAKYNQAKQIKLQGESLLGTMTNAEFNDRKEKLDNLKKEMAQTDDDRRKELHNIILDLLRIAEKKL